MNSEMESKSCLEPAYVPIQSANTHYNSPSNLYIQNHNSITPTILSASSFAPSFTSNGNSASIQQINNLMTNIPHA